MAREPFLYSRRHLLVIAVGWVIIGGFVGIFSLVDAVPAWQAAQGGGVTGTFTLTEPMSCDRYQPPRQRCGWFGDFRSDDGKTVRWHMELAGGLPPGARMGDTVPARDTGSPTEIFQLTDHQAGKQSALFAAVGFGGCLIGLLAIDPWHWIRKRPQASSADER